VDITGLDLILGEEISADPPRGARRFAARPTGNRHPPSHVPQIMECVAGSWLVALPAIDGKAYVYRVHAPQDALLADLFWQAWHCHDESALPRASDLFDAAVIRRVD